MLESTIGSQWATSHFTSALLPTLILSSPLSVRGVYHMKWTCRLENTSSPSTLLAHSWLNLTVKTHRIIHLLRLYRDRLKSFQLVLNLNFHLKTRNICSHTKQTIMSEFERSTEIWRALDFCPSSVWLNPGTYFWISLILEEYFNEVPPDIPWSCLLRHMDAELQVEAKLGKGILGFHFEIVAHCSHN